MSNQNNSKIGIVIWQVQCKIWVLPVLLQLFQLNYPSNLHLQARDSRYSLRCPRPCFSSSPSGSQLPPSPCQLLFEKLPDETRTGSMSRLHKSLRTLAWTSMEKSLKKPRPSGVHGLPLSIRNKMKFDLNRLTLKALLHVGWKAYPRHE